MILFPHAFLTDPRTVLHNDDNTLRINADVRSYLAAHVNRWTHDLFHNQSRFSFELEADRDAFEAWIVGDDELEDVQPHAEATDDLPDDQDDAEAE